MAFQELKLKDIGIGPEATSVYLKDSLFINTIRFENLFMDQNPVIVLLGDDNTLLIKGQHPVIPPVKSAFPIQKETLTSKIVRLFRKIRMVFNNPIKKEFLRAYPIEYSVPRTSAKAVRAMIQKCAESHAIEYTEEDWGSSYINFYISVPRTSFANSYAHIGGEFRELVLQGKIHRK